MYHRTERSHSCACLLGDHQLCGAKELPHPHRLTIAQLQPGTAGMGWDGTGQGRAGGAESRSRRVQPSQKLTCTRRMLSRAFQHLPVPPPELEGISAMDWLHVWGVPGSDCLDILPFLVLPHCCQVFQACRHCRHSTAACQDMGYGEAVAWLWRGKDGLGFQCAFDTASTHSNTRHQNPPVLA